MDHEPIKLIRMKEVCKMTGLTPSSITRYEDRGDFPKRRKLSSGWVCWSDAEVQEWIRSKWTDAA